MYTRAVGNYFMLGGWREKGGWVEMLVTMAVDDKKFKKKLAKTP